MGQYHMPVILNDNKRLVKNAVDASLYSYDYHNGLKLMEHSYIDNPFVCAFENLIFVHETDRKQDGAFAGQRVAWAGDYGESWKSKKKDAPNLYFLASETEGLTDKTKKIADIATQADMARRGISEPRAHRYIVNLDKKVYVDLNKIKRKTDWGAKIHPLPLLLSMDNGGGGGDYWGTCEDAVGTWALDRVVTADSIKTNMFKDFKRVEFDFSEER